MLSAQVRKVAVVTAVILVAVLAIDIVISVALFPDPHKPYSPLTTIIITLAVAPPFSFYLIRQADRVQTAQAASAEFMASDPDAEAYKADIAKLVTDNPTLLGDRSPAAIKAGFHATAKGERKKAREALK